MRTAASLPPAHAERRTAGQRQQHAGGAAGPRATCGPVPNTRRGAHPTATPAGGWRSREENKGTRGGARLGVGLRRLQDDPEERAQPDVRVCAQQPGSGRSGAEGARRLSPKRRGPARAATATERPWWGPTAPRPEPRAPPGRGRCRGRGSRSGARNGSSARAGAERGRRISAEGAGERRCAAESARREGAGRRRAPQPAARIAASRGARGAQSAPERSGSGAQLRNPPTPPRSASGAAPRTRVGRGGLSTARSEVCGGGEEESGRRSRGSTGALGQPFESGESPGDPLRAAPRRGDRAARERGERGSAELSPGARGALPAARGTRPRGSRRHRGGHGHRDSPRTAGRAHSPGKHTTSWSTELVIFKKKIHQHGCSSLRMSKAAHRKRGEGLKQLTHTEIKRNKGEKKKKKGGG